MSIHGSTAGHRARLESGFHAIAALGLLAPLLGFGYVGTFSRYLADDYCTAATLENLGFFRSQAYWYLGWSGRYSFTFVMNLAQLIGNRLTPYLPAAVVLLWTLALTWLAREGLNAGRRRHPTMAPVLLAGAALVPVVLATPDRYQSLFWQTGLLTYSLPLLIVTAYLAWAIRQIRSEAKIPTRIGLLGLSALMTLAAGGFSETIGAVQAAALFACLLASAHWLRGETRKRAAIILGAGLTGSLLAITIVALAPGNEVRLAAMPGPTSLPSLVVSTLRYSLAFGAKAALGAPLALLLALLVPGMIAASAGDQANGLRARHSDRSHFTREAFRALAVPLLTYVLIAASIAPSVYATGSYPAERSLITGQYLLALGIGTWGYQWGSRLGRSRLSPRESDRINLAAWGMVAVVAVAVGMSSVVRVVSESSDASGFAQMWEGRDELMKSAARTGTLDVAVPSLPHMGSLAEITDDPDFWVNRCVAESYGLQSVTARQ